jgi:GT2 family glycosyltransferase
MKYDIDILLIIVLYKVKLDGCTTFLTLAQSVSQMDKCVDLFVYDNSPESYQDYTAEIFKNFIITYQHDPFNSGVSKAYNKGAEIARKMGKKWILLLDQDTIFPLNMISAYLSSIMEFPHETLFAPVMKFNEKKIISPCYFKFMRGFSVSQVNAGLNSLDTYSVINCGMCIDVDAFHENGGYNEDIKLDFSDHDFIRRFRKNVSTSFIVIDLKVKHQLSSEAKNSFVNDKVRFGFYIDGGKKMESSILEALLIRVNFVIRALKLSVIHKTSYFLLQLFLA